MHSFEAYERLIESSMLIALAVLFIVAALSLLTGCGEESLPPRVVADAPRPNVQIVNIWPDKSNRWPPPSGSPLKQNEGAHS